MFCYIGLYFEIIVNVYVIVKNKTSEAISKLYNFYVDYYFDCKHKNAISHKNINLSTIIHFNI